MNDKIFEIIGAGKLRLSDNADCKCGGEKGFSFEITWSKFNGFSGGLISRQEAIELANYILEKTAHLTPKQISNKTQKA